MNLPTISPSLPASASTQPLLRYCLTSVQPLLDEKLYEKAFSFLPADGCWALRKEKLLRLQKPEDRALTLAAGLLARLAFLKMDVEGSEARAILGSANAIRRHKPKLMISAYHRSEDLFALPLQIQRIQPGYRFYLRRFPYIPAWEINLIGLWEG